jgi:hypothetical protein
MQAAIVRAPATVEPWGRRCQRSSVAGLTGNPAQAARGSERLSAASSPGQPASASADEPADAASRVHGAAPESRAPSSDAAAPAAKRARTGSARRDTRTTNARSPSLGHDSNSAEPSEIAVRGGPSRSASTRRRVPWRGTGAVSPPGRDNSEKPPRIRDRLCVALRFRAAGSPAGTESGRRLERER